MTLAGSGGALGPRWSPVAARHFALQAWQLATATFVLHGTYDTALALVARWVSAGRPWRRGTFAGLAVGDSDLRFAWLVARLGAVGRPWRRGTLRGRLGTWRHRPLFCVASIALVRLDWLPWRAWAPLVARGAATLCMAGVASGGINLRFMWQAWRFWHWAGSGGAWSPLVARGTLRGRRGAWRHQPSVCAAGVALGDINIRFSWQPWRLVASTFRLRGRHSTW